MKRLGRLPHPTPVRAGFTMAELAVTMLIVFVTLLGLIQGLSTAKFSAANTKNLKIANQLALETLGKVEAGLYWEDMDELIEVNFAEEGYDPRWWYGEILFGDEMFPDEDDRDADDRPWHDSFQLTDEEEEEREDQRLPYEKVKVRIYFPQLAEYDNKLTVERWIPWDQVYGPEEEGDQDDR